MNKQTENLNNRALLVALNMRVWSGRKYDKATSLEVTTAKHAASEAGRFNKLLIPSKEIKPVTKACNALRTINYAETLPYVSGLQLLPLANYEHYLKVTSPLVDDVKAEMQRFIDRYPALVASAPERLSGLHNSADYPPVEIIRERFSVAIELLPLPAATPYSDAFGIGDAELARIKQETENAVLDRVNDAMRGAFSRLFDVLQDFAITMRDKDKIFRDSKVENISKLLDTLPRLNLTGDPDLTARINDARDLIRYPAQQLRDNPDARERVADEADAILAKMANIF